MKCEDKEKNGLTHDRCFRCLAKEKELFHPNKKSKRKKIKNLDLIEEPDDDYDKSKECRLCLELRRQRYPFDYIDKNVAEYLKQLKYHFVVIGAGIAGIAASIVLLKLGFNVTLVEKDAKFESRQQGYGLTLQQGTVAIRQLGLKESERMILSGSHYAFDSHGKILGYFGSTFSKFYEDLVSGKRTAEELAALETTATGKFKSCGTKFNVHVPRQELRRLLFDRLNEVAEAVGPQHFRLLWSHPFSRLSDMDNKVKVEFTNNFAGDPLSVEADYVLACDGIHSPLRKLLQPGVGLQFLNCIVVLGISHLQNEFLLNRVFETMDGDTRIYVMPYQKSEFGLQDTMWQLSFLVEDEKLAFELCKNKESLKEEALRRCAEWHAPIVSLIESTSLDLLTGHPVYDRPPLTLIEFKELQDNLPCGNKLLFLGDSLHPMSPFKGQGANQALLDACLLGQDILENVASAERPCNAPAFGNIFDKYHKTALERSKNKVTQSNDAVKALHSSDALRPSQIPCSNTDSLLDGTSLGDYLGERHISANSGVHLDKDIVLCMGFGSRPHLLHMNKIEASRQLYS